MRRSAGRKYAEEEIVHVEDDMRDGGPGSWRWPHHGHPLIGGGRGRHWRGLGAGGDSERDLIGGNLRSGDCWSACV
jgi:hypothetical protein